MKVLLLQHTAEPEKIVAQAGRLCYSPVGLEQIAEALTPEKTALRIRSLIELGHDSALEHASFTFGVEGVSRALTHQLVRHRLASYSQQSQRYVAMKNFAYITPPTFLMRKEWEPLEHKYREMMGAIGELYEEMLAAEVPAEDARYLLPNACETKIVVTMNARELRHFFLLRCCNRAQWEIHGLADEMLKLAQEKAPNLFRGAGPGCLSGICPEGKMTCGMKADVRKKYLGGQEAEE